MRAPRCPSLLPLKGTREVFNADRLMDYLGIDQNPKS